MNYLEEIPLDKANKIIKCECIDELKWMRIKHSGPKNVFIRLAIDERIENLMHKAQKPSY